MRIFWSVVIFILSLDITSGLGAEESSADREGTIFTTRDRMGEYSLTTSMMVGGAVDLRSEEGAPDHNLALVSVQVGWEISGRMAKSKWYKGNWRLSAEIFCGGQVASEASYIMGVLPVVSYEFETGGRWSPFVLGGVGFALTDIGLPDLGTKFQFTEQIGVGIRWKWNPGMNLKLETRVAHLSNGGIRKPNTGINTINIFWGVEWGF